jgi:hypothetical protein
MVVPMMVVFFMMVVCFKESRVIQR